MDTIKIGDCLKRTVYSSSNVLLAKSGTFVTTEVLNKLHSNGITEWYVEHDNTCKEVSVSELKIGDYLAKSVRSKVGVTLAHPGSCVDEEILKALRGVGGTVFIQVSGGVGKPVIRNKVPVVTMSQRFKERAHESIEYMFKDLGTEQSFKKAETLADDICTSISGFDFVEASLTELRICDEYTFKHSVDVGLMGAMLARKFGYDDNQVHEVALAGLVHDLGKAKVPIEILNKPAKLTDEEFTIMKKHVDYGYELVAPSKTLSPEVKRGMHEHHEKINGYGYSSGLRGNEISIIGRMLAIADVYDALVTARPYKDAKSPGLAADILYENKEAGHFDGVLYHLFINCLVLYQEGSIVTLSDGKKCYVVKHNEGFPSRPILCDKETGLYIDLLRDKSYLKVHIMT